MAIKADFHMHTSFSGDSDAPMEEVIQRAIALGLTHICITEHYDPDYVYAPEEDGYRASTARVFRAGKTA